MIWDLRNYHSGPSDFIQKDVGEQLLLKTIMFSLFKLTAALIKANSVYITVEGSKRLVLGKIGSYI